MTRDQLDTLTRRYLSARFDEIESALALEWDEPKGNAEVALDVWGDELAEQCERLTATLAFCDYSGAMGEARAMLPGADEDTQRKLARRLLEAQLEAHKATLRALSGEPLAFPSLAPAGAPAAAEPQPTPKLSEVAAQYAEDKRAAGAWSPRSDASNVAYLALVCELLGDACVGEVTKAHIRELSHAVPRLPLSRRTKRYEGKSVAEVLALVGDDPGVRRIKPRTVNVVFGITRSLFQWAKDHDIIAGNPAEVLADVPEGRARDQRAPLTDSDIAAFLAQLDAAPPCHDEADNTALWWIARIIALSGMRLGEAAQLRKGDVRTVDGVPVFDVNDEDGKALKNAASVRLVPIHPRLLELGLLAFVAEQPDGYLWPERFRSRPTAKHSLTDKLSERLMLVLRRAGVTDSRKVLHSFRHTVSDRLGALSVPEYQIADILGHETGTMTRGRYGGATPLPVLRDVLSKLTLPI